MGKYLTNLVHGQDVLIKVFSARVKSVYTMNSKKSLAEVAAKIIIQSCFQKEDESVEWPDFELS